MIEERPRHIAFRIFQLPQSEWRNEILKEQKHLHKLIVSHLKDYEFRSKYPLPLKRVD